MQPPARPSSDPATPSAMPRNGDARTIALVGVAHGTSHFFHLLLPPLFPVFMREFSLDYAQLGLLVTVFFAISGIGQALAGFMVDRIGARPMLFFALGCFVAAALAAASASGYAGLALAAALAGVGNASFHPVDFTILNERVSTPRLGHAYSVHGITGNLGWALAPVFLAGIAAASGSWRWAYVAAALVAVVVLALVYVNRDALDDRHDARVQSPRAAPGASGTAGAAAREHPMAFMKLPSVWLCFAFFFWSTAALSAIQGFAGPALQQLYGLPLSLAAFVVTGYMLCGAAGMVAGGFLVAKTQRLERTIGWALAAGGAMLVTAGSGMVAGGVAAVLVALAGFGVGLAGPSRDMLIKRASPPGATGRVYGTVYSGLDIGFALAAPVFGALLDRGHADGVFYGAALALGLGVASAALVGLRSAPPRTATPATG